MKGYGMRIDFERDVMPIFATRCASCHGGGAPAAGLALDRPGHDGAVAFPPGSDKVSLPSTWWCLVADRDQFCAAQGSRFQTVAGTTIVRPQLTKYVRAFNSLGSLLYWKAANERTDRNTDATFTAASPPGDRDIDFGADHPTDITREELGILSRWIDIGSPGGPQELRDTQKPTLTLVATVDSQAKSIGELRVGTVDLGRRHRA